MAALPWKDAGPGRLPHVPWPRRVMAPVQWYGGKGRLAGWIRRHIPPGKVYVEPFAGAASLLFHLPPRPVEVLNDLNRDLVGLFRTLQDPRLFEELQHRLTWTLYSFEEFRRARRVLSSGEQDQVARAWAFFVAQNQGFGGKAKHDGDWGRVFVSFRGMAGATCRWRARLKLLEWWHDRLSRVQVDCRDALECIRYWDSPETVFYVDPPYIAGTRAKGKRHVYTHEMSDEDHRGLVRALLSIRGKAVLSAYEHPIYAPLLRAGWTIERRRTACHAAGRVRGSGIQGKGAARKKVPRTECLYISGAKQLSLL